VYNHSNGVWMNLSGNDTGDWVGTTIVYNVAVNTNDNLVYTGLTSGKFGVYNHSGSFTPSGGGGGGGGSGGGGDTPLGVLSGFNVAPQKMSVVLKPNESKTECFTVASTGTLSVNANLNVLGEIIPFTNLTNSVLQIPVGTSKSACAVFSANLLDIPKNYSGKIEIKDKQTKYIDVSLEIVNITNVNITNISFGILPVGIEGFLPGDPIRVLPVGILGFLPGDPISVLPVGIKGFLPSKQPKIAETLVKGVIFISLWILLLLLLVIYLAVRKFVRLQNQLQGYESREEKFEAIGRLKRNLLRKDVNFFEKVVDKGTIYLSEKALHKKKFNKQIPEILSTELKEKYDSGAWLYSHKDYDNALKEFVKCVEINNKFWQGYQGIGSCCLAQGRIKDAIAAFEKSLSINPNNAKLAELLKKRKEGK
ncbi:MAG: tetratricopeptide repeat protein, partial [Nanoarchaeota archaeon]